MTQNDTPQLLGLDWGTSSARVYLLGAAGQVLECRDASWGILQVAGLAAAENLTLGQAFGRTLELLCGDLLTAHPQLPLIASGMVGSQQGWVEAPYLVAPVDLTAPELPLTPVGLPGGRTLHLVPGIVADTELPDVMRGEETQILGALTLQAATRSLAAARQLLVLPGTHSKWVTVVGTTVDAFTTSMTGETYALLAHGSLLAKLSTPAATPDWAAFDRGVRVAYSTEGEAGIMMTAFSARTLVLRGRLGRDQVADYLSGLMIGAEIRSVATRFEQLPRRITICGNEHLTARYHRALAAFGDHEITDLPHTAPAGLFALARVAGLLPARVS